MPVGAIIQDSKDSHSTLSVSIKPESFAIFSRGALSAQVPCPPVREAYSHAVPSPRTPGTGRASSWTSRSN